MVLLVGCGNGDVKEPWYKEYVTVKLDPETANGWSFFGSFEILVRSNSNHYHRILAMEKYLGIKYVEKSKMNIEEHYEKIKK